MKYSKLTEDTQKQMLEQRLSQYEQEHYNHQVNKELLVSSGKTDEETKKHIKDAEAAMKMLDEAHAEVLKKIK